MGPWPFEQLSAAQHAQHTPQPSIQEVDRQLAYPGRTEPLPHVMSPTWFGATVENLEPQKVTRKDIEAWRDTVGQSRRSAGRNASQKSPRKSGHRSTNSSSSRTGMNERINKKGAVAARHGIRVDTSVSSNLSKIGRVDERPLGLVRLREQRSGPVGGKVRSPGSPGKGSMSIPKPRRAVEELSPEDRAILIGFDLSPATIVQTQVRAETVCSISDSPSTVFQDSDAGDLEAITPSILVTPAQNDAQWPDAGPTSKLDRQARTRSSYYSQASPVINAAADHYPSMMPALPKSLGDQNHETTGMGRNPQSRDSNSTLFEEDAGEETGKRMSLGSEAEERLVPHGEGQHRSLSRASTLAPVDHASLSPSSLRHRSRGWWNYVVIPFLSRSNTVSSRRSPKDDTPPPEMPNIALAAARAGLHKDNATWEKQGSPTSPEPEQTKGIHPAFKEDSGLHRALPAGISRDGPASLHEAQESGSTLPFFLAQDHGPQAPSGEIARAINVVNQAPPVQGHPFPNFPVPPKQGGEHEPTSARVHDPTQAHALTTLKNTATVHNTHIYHFHQQPSPAASAITRSAPMMSPHQTSSIPAHSLNSVAKASVEREQPMRSARASPIPQTRGPQPPASSPSNLAARDKTISSSTSGQWNNSRNPGAGAPTSQPTAAVGGIQPMHFPPPPRSFARSGRSFNGTIISGSGLNTGSSNHHAIPEYLNSPATMRRNVEIKVQKADKKSTTLRRLKDMMPGKSRDNAKKPAAGPPKERRNKKKWLIGLTTALILMIILILAVTLTVTRGHKNSASEQTQWLNLTGWPPIPTGVSTIIEPDKVEEMNGCASPATMWSCSLPKELQRSESSAAPDQPNFQLEIRHQNSTEGNSTSAGKLKTRALDDHSRRSVAGGSLMPKLHLEERALRIRDSFDPFPLPPSLEDQRFIGDTTDNVESTRKEGEQSPFYITFTSPASLKTSNLNKRQTKPSSPDKKTDSFPDLSALIPSPAVDTDGTAKAATLLPLPSSQPLRLYDRGLSTEHYGFYSYFDRSIFLQTTVVLNQTAVGGGELIQDATGGSKKDGANAQCTWASTRFLVQIWTRQPIGTLLNQTTSEQSNKESTTSKKSLPSKTTRPGSFPYPLTITTDRHGGDVSTKMIYCYGIDSDGKPNTDLKKIQVEDREFGGRLVGGGQGPLGKDKVTIAQGGLGGIDGGTGGCSCRWKNFATTIE